MIQSLGPNGGAEKYGDTMRACDVVPPKVVFLVLLSNIKDVHSQHISHDLHSSGRVHLCIYLLQSSWCMQLTCVLWDQYCWLSPFKLLKTKCSALCVASLSPSNNDRWVDTKCFKILCSMQLHCCTAGLQCATTACIRAGALGHVVRYRVMYLSSDHWFMW